MITLEVPFVSMPADDPAYEMRAELVEARNARQPLPSYQAKAVGHLANRAAFSSEVDFAAFKPGEHNSIHYYCRFPFSVNYLDGAAQYSLPEPLLQFEETIQKVAEYEHTNYPHARYSRDTIGLLVKQKVVGGGEAQVGSGDVVHRDGGADEWGHFYIVSDAYPTEFFESEAPVEDDDNHIDPTPLGEPFVPQPHEVAFINTTSLHRSPIVPETVLRTFVRIAYTHEH